MPGATPTGLGLSGLLPLSPLAAMPLHSKTPAVTPSCGAVDQHGKVSSALHAAAQALGGSPLATPAGSPLLQQQAPAAAEEEQSEDLLFTGFGSPLKQEAAESPAATAVSIGDAIIPAAPAAEASSEACSSFTHIDSGEPTVWGEASNRWCMLTCLHALAPGGGACWHC